MKRILYLFLFVGIAQPLLAQNLLLNRTNGNVGIGIASPSSKLHVLGTTTLNGGAFIVGEPLTYTANAGINGGALRIDNPGSGFVLIGGPRLYLDQDRLQVIYSPALLGLGNYPSPSSLLLNPLGGNVGIGTSNPTYKLSVNGTIRSKELIVETGWADFVFDGSYRLRPLAEVEQFIKTHHHLPDMASAGEISQQGMPIAETITRMMQKIEELTLYVIAQQNQLATQQRQIRQLKARLNR